MGAAREKVQADFDLERFIDMFDEALTSQDERVINALRNLMMMVILTKPESRDQAGKGPLRQLYDDLHHLNRRMHAMEDDLRQVVNQLRKKTPYEYTEDEWNRKYSLGTGINLTKAQYDKAMQDMLLTINSPGKPIK